MWSRNRIESMMEPSLNDVLQRTVSGKLTRAQFQFGFDVVHHLCSTEESIDVVYRALRSTLEHHVRDVSENRLNRSSDVEFLIAYRNQWLSFCKLVEDLERQFREVDRQITLINKFKSEERLTIQLMALEVWQDDVLCPLRDEITARLMSTVNQDREGKPAFSNDDLTTVVASIAKLDGATDNRLRIYEQYRNAYFVNLEEYFWTTMPETESFQEFLQNTKKFIECELPRARKYLRPDDTALEGVHRLILANNPEFLKKTLRTAVINLDYAKLKELHGLLKPIHGDGRKLIFEAITTSFPHHVAEDYSFNSEGGNDPAGSFVNTILMVEDNLTEMVREAFAGDPSFDDACAAVCRDAVKNIEMFTKESSAELVAIFYDSILSSGPQRDEQRMERELNRALKAARYVNSAVVFHEAYLTRLRQRLVKSRWSDLKFENKALDALLAAGKASFGDEALKVLRDVVDSRLVNQVYQSRPRTEETPDIEVTVLCRELWFFDGSLSPEVELPKNIKDNLEYYTGIYAKSNPRLLSRENPSTREKMALNPEPRWKASKKLKWFHNLAQAEIEAEFPRGSYLMKCSAFTAIVLLLFEGEDTLSASFIRRKTKLSKVDLEVVLEQLEEANILKKLCHTNELDEPTQFALNLGFTSGTNVVNLVEPAGKRSAQKLNGKATNPVDRQFYMEALLIRLLKKHEQLSYDTLVNLVSEEAQLCQLDAELMLIKKSLTSLEEKLYIEVRGSTYHYLP